MTTVAGNRTARILLSSTFRDFGEERDLLVRKVFPALRAKLYEAPCGKGKAEHFEEAQMRPSSVWSTGFRSCSVVTAGMGYYLAAVVLRELRR